MKNSMEKLVDILNSPDNWIYRVIVNSKNDVIIYRCVDDYADCINDNSKWELVEDAKAIALVLKHIVALTLEPQYDCYLFLS